MNGTMRRWMQKRWTGGLAAVAVAAGCGPPAPTMQEACSAAISAWHLPGAVEGYVDPAATEALVAAAGVACNEVCQSHGVVDSATFGALKAAGLLETPNYRFQHTPWASASASREIHELLIDEHRDIDATAAGDTLWRREVVARLSVVADEVPGGLTGEARCYFIEDDESGEFWFWRMSDLDGSSDWSERDEPQVLVYFEYDPFLALPPD